MSNIHYSKINVSNSIDEIQNSIVSLWENVSFYDYKVDSVDLLYNKFYSILHNIKQCIDKNKASTCMDIIRHSELIDILENIYCFTAYIRDIHLGLGFRELFYSFVYALYHFFPSLTCSFWKYIVNHSIGSWRDAQETCNYFKNTSTKGSEHPFIEFIVRNMNEVLHKDMSNNVISNCAKWVPREKSKNDWLFKKLAIQWSQTHSSYLLKTPKDDYAFSASLRKCYMLYRKLVSKLSKSLPIVEHYLCSNKMNLIRYSDISQRAFVKNWYKLFNQTKTLSIKNNYSINHILCVNNLNFEINHSFKVFNSTNYAMNCLHFPDSLPEYVSFAFKCVSILNSAPKSLSKCENIGVEINNLNTIWKDAFLKWSCFVNVPINSIAVINNHITSLSDPVLYRSIAYACFITQGSNIKRILFCAHSPIWINLEDHGDFFTMINTIYDSLYNEVLVNTSIQDNIKEFKNMKYFNPIIIHQNGYCCPYNYSYNYKEFLSIVKNKRYKNVESNFISFLEKNDLYC